MNSTGSAFAQRPWIRGNMREVIRQLESDTDRFKGSLDSALDRSNLNGSRTEDEVKRLRQAFEQATDRLRDRSKHREYAPNAARDPRPRTLN